MTFHTTLRITTLLLAGIVCAGSAAAQGITTRAGAVVLFGSTGNCSQPSTIRYQRVQRATPEYKTIRSEGVGKGSARHDLLTAQMNKRIKRAVAAAAQAASRDCVVRKGDVQNADGLTVTDLTAAVIGQLGS